jgi:hypothetical protein
MYAHFDNICIIVKMMTFILLSFLKEIRYDSLFGVTHCSREQKRSEHKKGEDIEACKTTG